MTDLKFFSDIVRATVPCFIPEQRGESHFTHHGLPFPTLSRVSKSPPHLCRLGWWAWLGQAGLSATWRRLEDVEVWKSPSRKSSYGWVLLIINFSQSDVLYSSRIILFLVPKIYSCRPVSVPRDSPMPTKAQRGFMYRSGGLPPLHFQTTHLPFRVEIQR